LFLKPAVSVVAAPADTSPIATTFTTYENLRSWAQ